METAALPALISSGRATGSLAEAPLLNRELSWIEFNSRVLDEALDPSQPLLERLKFLSIFSTNLDEFFMVRVSGLVEQFEANPLMLSPDGLTPASQLRRISERLRPLLEVQMRCLVQTDSSRTGRMRRPDSALRQVEQRPESRPERIFQRTRFPCADSAVG